MNILHISSANSWRGGEQQIAYLIDELHSLGQTNFLMHPTGAPISSHLPIKGKSKNIKYHKGFSVNPLVALTIKRVVSKHSIDIIHVHDSHAHTFLYLSYRMFGLKCPSVVSRRVDFPISTSSIKKYSFSQIHKILCVSNKINEIVSASLGKSDRIKTIYSGIDLDKYDVSCQIDLRAQYSIPNDYKIIANISAIADHKDYDTFINTAAKVLELRSDIIFFIIGGDGGELENITAKISSLDLCKNIILTGYVKNAYTLLNQIDIFFFPSKMEGLGTSILDAQACEVPVISTIAGGIPELVVHSKTGLLSKIGDSEDLANNINKVLNDSNLKNRLILQAKENVKHFTKESTAQQTLAVYQDVI